MIDVQRTFTVSKDPGQVVAYLKDFGNAEQWDPGTVTCVQVSPGQVEEGTTWRNVSKFRGKETELTYRLDKLSEQELVFVGENKTAHSTDTITVIPAGAASSPRGSPVYGRAHGCRPPPLVNGSGPTSYMFGISARWTA